VRQWRKSGQFGNQVLDPDTEGLGESDYVESRAVADAAFNPAHVAAADAGEVGQGFLGQPFPPAQFADSSANPLEREVFGGKQGLPGHPRHPGASYPIGPRPTGYNLGWLDGTGCLSRPENR
jgi:hypothetical protein